MEHLLYLLAQNFILRLSGKVKLRDRAVAWSIFHPMFGNLVSDLEVRDIWEKSENESSQNEVSGM